MAIELNEGFCDIKLGRHQLVRVKRASYDETKGIASVTFEDKRGATLREVYKLKKNKKGKLTTNDGALSAFSTMVKHVIGDLKAKSIEPRDLKGHYVYADILLDEWDDPETGKHHTYKHARNFEEADGDTFDDPDDVDEEDDDIDEDDEDDEDDELFDD